MSLPSDQPNITVQEPETQGQVKAERQMCEICGSYVAKTFFVLNGTKHYICQPDAYTMLRMLSTTQPASMQQLLTFMNEQIYGKE